MLARIPASILLAACLLAQPAIAATKPVPKPAVKAPAKGKAPKPLEAPRPSPSSGSAKSDLGDSLVEAVGTSPELQGEGLFTNTINWTKRAITVLGIGIAPERGSLYVRKTIAQTNAREDAYRALEEAVAKVRVNADAYVRDFLVSDEETRAKIKSRIGTAKVSDTQFLPDGSVQLKLQLPLFGKDGLAGAVLRDEPSPILFASEGTPSLPTTAYTGIIIDARGTGAQPALAPSIRSVEGSGFADRPPVAYAHSRETAGDLAGDHPLTITAKRATGLTKADLLLDKADMKKVQDAWTKGGLSVIVML